MNRVAHCRKLMVDCRPFLAHALSCSAQGSVHCSLSLVHVVFELSVHTHKRLINFVPYKFSVKRKHHHPTDLTTMPIYFHRPSTTKHFPFSLEKDDQSVDHNAPPTPSDLEAATARLSQHQRSIIRWHQLKDLRLIALFMLFSTAMAPVVVYVMLWLDSVKKP